MANYTDLTDVFLYADVLRALLLNSLAENDSYLKNNGWEDGCVWIFHQASAPLGWTKKTDADLNDKLLRAVSGSGGGTGGSQAPSSVITLAHTHDISSEAAHSHDMAHSHSMDAGPIVNNRRSFTYPVHPNAGYLGVGEDGSSSAYARALSYTDSDTQESATDGVHDHTGSSGSDLANITLAYIDVIACTKDTGTGYQDKTGAFTFLMDLGDDDVYLDLNDLGANDAYNYARVTPDSTLSIFFQAAAPTGWTKSSSYNGAGIRMVTGTGGGSGGSTDPGSEITIAHNSHTVSADGAHGHDGSSHTHNVASLSGYPHQALGSYLSYDSSEEVIRMRVSNQPTPGYPPKEIASSAYDAAAVNLTGVSDHTHVVESALSNIQLLYVDVILCSKDAMAAGYVNMSTFFAADNLLAIQDLDALAENDALIEANQIRAGSCTSFLQASAPLNWTKSAVHNDKCLRVVSGDGGGSGGSKPISEAWSLAHSHVLESDSHSHALPDHAHTLGVKNDVYYLGDLEGYAVLIDTTLRYVDYYASGSTSYTSVKNTATTIKTSFVESVGHSHGGTLNSALSNISLAYADVILCVKN